MAPPKRWRVVLTVRYRTPDFPGDFEALYPNVPAPNAREAVITAVRLAVDQYRVMGVKSVTRVREVSR